MKTLRRKPASIAKTRWLAYATAGAATALGSVTTAEAEIHYSGVLDIHFRGQKVRKLNLARPAVMLFERSILGYAGVDKFLLIATASHSVRGRSLYSISRLDSGENVSNVPFYKPLGYAYMVTYYGGGNFRKPGEAFIGFKFNQGAGTQYGWARVKMGGSAREQRFYLEDYAYGDVGDSITTGQTSSAGDRVGVAPDSGSLGLLALGAAGLVAWRQRRKENAA